MANSASAATVHRRTNPRSKRYYTVTGKVVKTLSVPPWGKDSTHTSRPPINFSCFSVESSMHPGRFGFDLVLCQIINNPIPETKYSEVQWASLYAC